MDHDEGEKSQEAGNGHACPIPERPRAPNPSADNGIVPPIVPPSFNHVGEIPSTDDYDVAVMEPLLALKILARGIQGLADITGNIPPTPPVSVSPSIQHLREDRGLGHRRVVSSRPATPTPISSNDVDSAQLHRNHIGAPEAHMSEPTLTPLASQRTQYDTIARKFYSKKPPPISIDDYLLRLHRYCPMSTAVYLAATVYIHKLAIEQRAVPVTTRTVHRLLLAALRVAMKALEDLSYPHKRFSGVGGVSEKELAKLEVSLCYLTDFELRVSNGLLKEKSWALLQMAGTKGNQAAFQLTLPTRARRGTT